MTTPSSLTPALTLLLLLVGGCNNQEREELNTDYDGLAVGVEADGATGLSDAVAFDELIDAREGSPNIADVSSADIDVSRPAPRDDVQSELDVSVSIDAVVADDVTLDSDSSISRDVVLLADVEGSSEASVESWVDIFPTDCVDFRREALAITRSTPDGVTNACVDDESQRIMAGLAEGVGAAAEDCGYKNLGRQQMGVCTLFCLVDRTGLSRACSSCYALKYVCQIDNCLAPCAAGPDSDACARCNEAAGCTARFNDCYGGAEGE